tara:strand:+ start:190 stop:402 length:213 start_codon:yes stop_codon:yes gene_type:complete
MSIIRADSIKNRAGNGAPTAPNGLVVSGVCSATSFVGSGTALTGIDAATYNLVVLLKHKHLQLVLLLLEI